MTRVRVVPQSTEPPLRKREEARDGWRVFRSKETGFQIAIPVYQVTRVEAIGRRERDEWYALAVGELWKDDQGVHSVLRDLVPNEWAERGRAHVHMGANAEARVRGLARDLHPGLVPLGNLHTHPRYGTRPSGTDRAEFWNDPHSVSIIVDPTDRPTLAVYRGRGGEMLEEVVEDLKVAMVPALNIPSSPPPLPPERPTVTKARSPWPVIVSGIACLLAGLTIIIAALLDQNVAKTAQRNAGLGARVSALEEALEAARRRELLREEEEGDEDAPRADNQCFFSGP